MKINNIENINEHVPKEGLFRWNSMNIIVTIDNGKWHASASFEHRMPNYHEMKFLRYKFMPNDIYAAEIFPPIEEFVNVNPFTRHLWEISKED